MIYTHKIQMPSVSVEGTKPCLFAPPPQKKKNCVCCILKEQGKLDTFVV